MLAALFSFLQILVALCLRQPPVAGNESDLAAASACLSQTTRYNPLCNAYSLSFDLHVAKANNHLSLCGILSE